MRGLFLRGDMVTYFDFLEKKVYVVKLVFSLQDKIRLQDTILEIISANPDLSAPKA